MAETLPSDVLWRHVVTLESMYREALGLGADASRRAEIELGLALTLIEQRRFVDARQVVSDLLARTPDHPQARWCAALLAFYMDDPWPEAWETIDARWGVGVNGAHPLAGVPELPVWAGESLAGRSILLAGEGAFGDQIQCGRFASALKDAGAGRVAVSASTALHELLGCARGVDAVVGMRPATNAPQPMPDVDLAIPMLSVPCTLRVTREQMGSLVPYLDVPPAAVEWGRRAVASMGSGLRVGLCWRSRSPVRSLPLRQLTQLFDVAGTSWVALGGPVDSGIVAGFPIASLGPHSVAEEAGLVQALDLVVTVDTLAAHLAGSVGRPVWTLLRNLPGVLWGAGGEGTPWYPTMRLFRQAADRSWPDVIQRVAVELGREVDSR